MHQPFIIQHLFQVSSLEEVSRERLEAFVETYPSYGIGHYLLSCKLQAEGSERFVPETQRTCLYFSNPLWLQWQLQNLNGKATEKPVTTTPVGTSYREDPAIEEAATSPMAESAVRVAEPAASEIEEPNVEATVENVVTMAEEAFVTPESLSTVEAAPITAGEGENLAAVSSSHGEPTAAEQLLQSIEEARGLRESLQKLDEEAATYEAAPEPVVHEAVTLQEEPASAEVAPQEEPIHDEETPFVLDEPAEQSVVAEETPQAVAESSAAPAAFVESSAAPEAAAESLPVAEAQPMFEPQPTTEAQAASEEAPKAAPSVTQDFLFEPYHTIDYFASQGIKLSLDENPQDKLGKQLKSFTEWLKTMRRLPQKDREVVPDRVMEEAIQTSAAHSIQGKDVLTETMAEVLAKQGMREKARAVYEKLSLLNPDKRAYFAAKIEQLNIS